jgi:hypothetical protein
LGRVDAIRGSGHGRTTVPFPRRRGAVRAGGGKREKRRKGVEVAVGRRSHPSAIQARLRCWWASWAGWLTSRRVWGGLVFLAKELRGF